MGSLQVAETIHAQIGNRACLMLGAKQFVGDSNSLQFAIQGSKLASKIVITLDSDDTYTVAFWKGRGINMRLVTEVSGVYADSLHRVIESHTGLRTSL